MDKTSFRRHAPTRVRGLTLIELMVVVAIVGILAAIAYPSFIDAIRKNRRSDAFAALSAVQQAQERWRSNQSAYTALLTDLKLGTTSSKSYYAISIDAADAAGYTATAAAVSGTTQAGDGDCRNLSVRVNLGNIYYGAAANASGPFDESLTNRCWV